MLSELPLLSLAIWFPVIGGVAILFGGDNPKFTRLFALTVGILTFLISTQLYTEFNTQTAAMQFQECIVIMEF